MQPSHPSISAESGGPIRQGINPGGSGSRPPLKKRILFEDFAGGAPVGIKQQADDFGFAVILGERGCAGRDRRGSQEEIMMTTRPPLPR